jgi:hypothetical protein
VLALHETADHHNIGLLAEVCRGHRVRLAAQAKLRCPDVFRMPVAAESWKMTAASIAVIDGLLR